MATKADLAGLGAEIAELRSDNKAEFAEVRSEIAELRSATTADFTKVRSELKTEIAELRTELKTDIAHLKSDMSDMFVKFSSLVIGAITLATGLLGFLIKF